MLLAGLFALPPHPFFSALLRKPHPYPLNFYPPPVFPSLVSRFVVHPKLVNFAAPSPYVVPPELSLDLDTLLKSLFQ